MFILTGVWVRFWPIVLGWPKSLFGFSRKIKDTFFIFTNDFIDLVILSMSLSPAIGFQSGEAGVLLIICQCRRQPRGKGSFGPNVPGTRTLHKPLLPRSISLSAFSTHCTNLLRFSCIFTFLETVKHNTPKHCIFSSIFCIKMATEALASAAQWIERGLWTKGSPVRFPVRAHAWVAGQVPSRGCVRGNHTLMFLSSFSLLSPLSKNK